MIWHYVAFGAVGIMLHYVAFGPGIMLHLVLLALLALRLGLVLGWLVTIC